MADESPAAAIRPQKPDEAAFKQSLAQIEKEHKQVMDQYVCGIHLVTVVLNGLHNP